MFRRFTLWICLGSCAHAQEKVTYDGHVQPIFQQSCLGCHNPDKSKGGLDLSTFAGTLRGGSGGKIVDAGDVGSSLIKVVEHTGGPKMPPEGDKLPVAHVLTLRKWIEGGLLENSASTVRKAFKPKFDSAIGAGSAAKPEGPPPMPADVLLEPVLVTARSSPVRSVAASPWAPLLAVTGQRQVLLYHTDSLELVGVLPFPEGDPVSLAFCPDAGHLLVGGGVPGKSGVTVTFDITRGTRVLTVGREFDTVLAADIRPGFDTVATGGPSRLVKLWDTATGETRKSVKKHTDWITSLDFSPDGVLLATGDRNGGVHVWESETGNEFHTLRAHQAGITAAVFRADSNILATSSADGTVRFWEMNGGTEVKKVDAHPGGVTALSFARDGAVLTAGRDRKVRLWKPDFSPARELAANLPALPVSAALAADGTRAFIGGEDGVVRVFLTADVKLVGEFSNNPPSIRARLDSIGRELSAKRREGASAASAKEVEALEHSQKHWSAAEINTRALRARAAAEEADGQRSEAQEGFRRTAMDVTSCAETLAEKRAQRARMAEDLEWSGLSPAARDEGRATLALLDAVISDLRQALEKTEGDLVRSRSDADQTAQRFYQETASARELTEAYRKVRQ